MRKLLSWIRSDLRIKRWLLLGTVGSIIACVGISFLLKHFFEFQPGVIPSVLLVVLGGLSVFISIRYVIRIIYITIIRGGYRDSMRKGKRSNLLYDNRILITGPKIVTIGGGTGLSSMLRGLKSYSSNITAIVTVADDGGGSGVLRQDLGILPPGDIRNCIVSLANTEPIMERLLQYRFQDGMLKGQSFGNLFLAAMDGISSNFEEAVRRMSDVLAVTGKVLPVTLEDMRIFAELEDGFVVSGESNIGKHNGIHPKAIKRVYMEPKDAKPLQEVIEAIEDADMIILGPGSLYTSVIPNLLIKEVCDALEKASAPKIYVCNIMTQPGETDGYTLHDHISAIERHSRKGIIDFCIVNTAAIPEEMGKKYHEDGAQPVILDIDKLAKCGIKVVGRDLAGIKNNYIRHDPAKLADAVIGLATDNAFYKDKKRINENYYKGKQKTTNLN